MNEVFLLTSSDSDNGAVENWAFATEALALAKFAAMCNEEVALRRF